MSRTTFEGGLGYEGKVTLTLKNNGRVLATKLYKNKGTSKLFEFLGYCLLDAYDDAKNLLPAKVRLLYNNDAKNNINEPYSADPKAVEPRTLPQERVQTPTINIDSNNAQVKVTYNFEISKAAITGEFNQIALYGAGVSETDYADFSAYYFLTNERGEFAALNAGDWSATTVLLIDWELTLSNKNIETSNN